MKTERIIASKNLYFRIVISGLDIKGLIVLFGNDMTIKDKNNNNRISALVPRFSAINQINAASVFVSLAVGAGLLVIASASMAADESARNVASTNSALSSGSVFYRPASKRTDKLAISAKAGVGESELAGPSHVVTSPVNKDSGSSLKTEKSSPLQKILRKSVNKPIATNCGPRVVIIKADCVITHAGVRVKSVPNFVCEFDKDKDGVLDKNDNCPDTPPRTRVYDNGCAVPIVFPEGILYRINSEFDFNKFNLRADALKTLKGLVKDLKATLHNEKVKIVGHTDSRGSNAYNVKLSKQRAGAVAKYLIDQGIRRYTIAVDGEGEEKPIASNETDEGRAINRRIDVYVEGKEEGYKTGKYADGSGCPVPTTTGNYTLTAQFDTGSAELKQKAINSLDEILDKLKATPLEEVINVVGHTDSRGSDDKNQMLSRNRAQSAADYLVQQGIPENHVIVEGKGESSPINSNESNSGRQKNRRIEITTR